MRGRIWVLLVLLLLPCARAESGYAIDVNLSAQCVTVYAGEGRQEGDIVRQMICSSGVMGTEDETPCGDFVVKQHYPDERSEWYYINQYGVYVQYVTRFNGPYLFHSLPYFEKDVATIDAQARDLLGTPASHGCIRLRSEDAQWIALNCPDGTPVCVRKGEADEELRARLLRRAYIAADWPSYQDYRSAEIPAGLTGALRRTVSADIRLPR